MVCMSFHLQRQGRYFGDSLQLTNLSLDSGATCHMTPEIYNCVPESLVEMDKCIEFLDGNLIIEKQIGEVKINICVNIG